MTKHEQRETRLRRARRAAQSKSARDRTGHSHHVPFEIDDLLPYTDPSMHHHMSDTRRHPQDVFSFTRQHPLDPATKVSPHFHYSISSHLLIAILRISYRD